MKKAGLSASKLADAIGGNSTARVNPYLQDGRIPTAVVTARLAHAVDQPWPQALLRAGYFREVLALIDLMARPLKSADEFAVIRLALKAFPRSDVAISTTALADDKSIQWIFKPITSDEASVDQIIDLVKGLGQSTRLHAYLERAATCLADKGLPVITRRRIAGELVNAWADDVDLAAAEQIRSEQLKQGRPTSQNWKDALLDSLSSQTLSNSEVQS